VNVARRRAALPVAALLCLVSATALAADKENRWSESRHGIQVRAVPRSPGQFTGFYLARHLPANAVAELAKFCLVTVSVRNHSKDVVWLEPARWRFTTVDGKAVERRDRAYWNSRWEELNVPLGAREAFGWSQLPESRDLQPGEPVGGNVVIVPPAGPFRLELRFATGADRNGPERVLRSDPLRCLRDGEAGS
jgi:hypothetical protein